MIYSFASQSGDLTSETLWKGLNIYRHGSLGVGGTEMRNKNPVLLYKCRTHLGMERNFCSETVFPRV